MLDDSTDHDTRALVDRTCAEVRASLGIDCRVLRRANRQGYKAGALESARRETDAEFLVIFDADFLPPADFPQRTIAHFYGRGGEPDEGLALVQAQWGHLSADESALTRAQSLWSTTTTRSRCHGARRCGSSSTSQARPAYGEPRRSRPAAAGALRASSRLRACTALFLADGLLLAAIGTTYVGACVALLAYFYGDHTGRVCFVINRARAAAAPA